MMSDKQPTGLSGEFKQFNRLLKQLKKLHKDTFQAIEDVTQSEDLSNEQINSLCATPSEVTELKQRIHAPVSIVIAGQENHGKVAILSKLLGVQLLPFGGTQHTCNQPPSSNTSETRDSLLSNDYKYSSSLKETPPHPRIRQVSENLDTYSNISHGFSSGLNSFLNEPFPPSSANASNTENLDRNIPGDREVHEKPWRGMKISYSTSQISYSVVRPTALPPECPCDLLNSLPKEPNCFQRSSIPSLENHERIINLSEVEPSVDVLSTELYNGLPNKDNNGLTPCSSTDSPTNGAGVLPQGIYEGTQPSAGNASQACGANVASVNDLSVSQLQSLLDEKLKEEEIRVAAELGQKELEQQLPYDGVKPIPLSEIELGQEHLNDPILRDAVLDVGLNHCLLKQVQIILTPTIRKYSTAKQSPRSKLKDKATGSQRLFVKRTKPRSGLDETLNSAEDYQGGSLSDISSASEAMCDSPDEDSQTETPFDEIQKTLFVGSGGVSLSCKGIKIPSKSSLEAQSLPYSSVAFGTPLSPEVSSFQSLPQESYYTCDVNRIPSASCLFLSTTVSSSHKSRLQSNHESYWRFNKRHLKGKHKDDAVSCYSSQPELFSIATDSDQSTNIGKSNSAGHISKSSGDSSKTATKLTASVDDGLLDSKSFLGSILTNINPIILYAITKDSLSPEDIEELKEIRSHSPNYPVAFVKVPPLQHIKNLSPLERRKLLSSIGILPELSSLCNIPSEMKAAVSPTACARDAQNSILPELSCTESCTLDNIPDDRTLEDSELIFKMDTAPVVKEQQENEEKAEDLVSSQVTVVNPPKARTVAFADECEPKSESSSRQNVVVKEEKSKKPMITSGNCAENYSSTDILRIKQKTSDLFKNRALFKDSFQLQDTDINDSLTSMSYQNSHSNSLKSVMVSGSDVFQLSESVIYSLTKTLNFFKTKESETSFHIHHGHIIENSQVDETRNPFLNTNREYHSSANCSSLYNNAFLSKNSLTGGPRRNKDKCSKLCVECLVIESFADFNIMKAWVKDILNSHISYSSQLLSKVQSRCLSSFVVFAFEFSRRLQITPRRLTYAKEQETRLYEELLSVARQNEEHIRDIISRTLLLEKEGILAVAEAWQPPEPLPPIAWLETTIQELVLREVNRRVGNQLVCGVQGLRENCIGTLQRCLSQLEEDCSRGGEQPSVTHALKMLVNAAYQVQVRPTSSWGLLRSLWESLKMFLGAGGSSVNNEETLPPSPMWRRLVAANMISNLSEKRLARSLSTQLTGEIKTAHAIFFSNLELLEHELSNSLENTQHQQMQLKAVHAPKLARLALHTDALFFKVNHGMPELGGELGRGHFGVVYSCKSWGNYSPCAIKTLLPRDSVQWKDIAMQYHYTRLMGHNDRIVGIHACLIDKHFGTTEEEKAIRGKSNNQCVLLIMDMHKWDLDTAIRRGLSQYQVFSIAIDVVQGIRFLHSQGLIHRDIKPKNILIDFDDRAKVTDLDFCKPEAMMTGSVVGTPIHMAPELFSGSYDNSVDVYAFGVLFWYLCSGKTNMPRNYCLQKSKEELKMAVFRGVRPECLSSFTPECWALMEQCWAHDPQDRLLLGVVEERLSKMLRACQRENHSSSVYSTIQTAQPESDDSFSSGSEDD